MEKNAKTTTTSSSNVTEKGLLETAELYKAATLYHPCIKSLRIFICFCVAEVKKTNYYYIFFFLMKYVLETSVYPREPQCLKELRAITSNHPRAIMGTAPDAGQLMALLLKLISAKKTIEIGVFTGYSLLLTALTIPDDGKITAIDLNRSSYEIGLPIIEKSGVKHKINFIESEALPILDELLKDPENKESFDFAFVDADKINYAKYHEKLLELLKPGGIVIYDNTLWGGSVALAEDCVPERLLMTRTSTIEFNKYLAADSRVQISQVPLGDGITVCRRL